MIQGIFYARFLPQEGPRVLAQSPPDLIGSSPSSRHGSGSLPPGASGNGAGPSIPEYIISTTSGPSLLPPQPQDGAGQPQQQAASSAAGVGAGGGRGTSSAAAAAATTTSPFLLDFHALRNYIIPRQVFCNRPLSVEDPESKYAVLGFPVLIPHPKYYRNEFIFNFCVVVDAAAAAAERVPYERVVRRLAVTFAEMEKQDGYLIEQDRAADSLPSAGGSVWTAAPNVGAGGGGGGGVAGSVGGGGGGETSIRGGGLVGDEFGGRRSVEGLLEIIREDLNTYGECMISIDDANTINMKLFPYHRPPPPVQGWHVPVAKMKFADVVDPTWDLTLQKVIAHIDGASDVRRIAYLADVSLDLTKAALRHLLYYDTVLLLDMFFFASCYAARPQGMADFVANADQIIDECAAYACLHGPSATTATAAATTAAAAVTAERAGVVTGCSVTTATGGGPATPTTAGATAGRIPPPRGKGGRGGTGRARLSRYLLIRLMTSFSPGKSVMEWLRGHMENGLDVLRYVDVRRFVQFGVIKGCLYRVHKYAVSKQYVAALATGQAVPVPADKGGDPLQRYTDGAHCFDQIVTELNLADEEITERLKSLPLPPNDLIVFYK